MYLFFDTETTGLPNNYDSPITDLENWPRLVQIAWLQYDSEKKKILEQDYIIKPEGFTIPGDASKVHGITTEQANKEGTALKNVLEEFSNLIDKSSLLVAHNMSFDERIVGAEFLRARIKHRLFESERICTMKATSDFCKLQGNNGYKWPKLSELHIKLFGEDIKDAHNASTDVMACAKCFWELISRGIIRIDR